MFLLHKGTTGWLRLVDGEAFGLDSSERLRCFVMNAISWGGEPQGQSWVSG